MAAADVDALDFEPDMEEDEDLLLDELDGSAMEEGEAVPVPKLKSTITSSSNAAGTSLAPPASSSGLVKKTKGRGFRDRSDPDRSSRFAGKEFDSLYTDGGPGPQRCMCVFLQPLLFLL
jgi:RNA-binding protein 8A